MNNQVISYQITPIISGHNYQIKQKFLINKGFCKIYLPIWIPGSYMRRDFVKYLYDLTVRVDDRVIDFDFVDLSSWQFLVEKDNSEIEIDYCIYARDISVRGNYLDHQRGFLNPCASCLAVADLENNPHQIKMNFTDQQSNWQINKINLLVNSYDQLIDTPLIFAEKAYRSEFIIDGIKHQLFLTGIPDYYQQNVDFDRLNRDIEQICRTIINQWGKLPKIDNYQFLVHFTEDGFGGLEHCDSTLLIAPRKGLPTKKDEKNSDEYISFLRLVAHEYFHTWNVKDLKPIEFTKYQLNSEQPTKMLWFFEGITDYFDALMLVKSNIISLEKYLTFLNRKISFYLTKSGRNYQSLVQSSYEAWTKLYQRNENSDNISISYYLQGSLLAFCIEAFLQKNNYSLMKLISFIWQDYQQNQLGLDEKRFVDLALIKLPNNQHYDFKKLIYEGLHTTNPLPIALSAQILGLNLQCNIPNQNTSYCGFGWTNDLLVNQLDGQSNAAKAGLAFNDQLVAINQLKATSDRLTNWLLKNNSDDLIVLTVFRDQVLLEISFRLETPSKTSAKLIVNDKTKANKWLEV